MRVDLSDVIFEYLDLETGPRLMCFFLFRRAGVDQQGMTMNLVNDQSGVGGRLVK